MKDFIIIEGCDGVGKTTIVNKLKDIGYKSLHFDFDPSLSIKQKYERILKNNYTEPVVLDRSFISELVYGPLNRGGSRLSDDDFKDLLSLVNDRNGRIIYLYATPEIIFKRISDRGDRDKNELDLNKIKQICIQYDKVIDSIKNCTLFKIDNNNSSPFESVQKIYKSNIDCLMFDFDDTLYSPYTCRLSDQILARMVKFIMNHFDIPYTPAREISREYRKKYGSTVNGLYIHHNIPPEIFIEYSYDMDLSELVINQQLRDNLSKIPEKKAILSNASEKYIEKSLELMGIREFFSEVVGIYKTNITPKPQLGSFKKIIELTNSDPNKCIFFDDQIENLKIAKSMGMKTVLTHRNKDETGTADIVTNNLSTDIVDIMSKLRGRQI